MDKLLSYVLFMAVFAMTACASTQAVRSNPELLRLMENRQATHRVDVLPAGHGSGVVISRDGHILTCNHVIENEPFIRISIGEGDARRDYRATVLATDAANDLAVIKIDRTFDRPVVLADAAEVDAGDEVYNVGYPYSFGEIIGRGYVMKRRYSDTDFRMPLRDVMLVDLPDGPGTSGSGVFLRRNGKLVGIMRMSVWVSSGRSPPVVVRVLVPVETVRTFLDANRIPYLTADPGRREARREGVAEPASVEAELSIVIVPPSRSTDL